MVDNEFNQTLLLSTLTDLKKGVVDVAIKVDTLSNDVAILKERHPWYHEKLTAIDSRVSNVEKLSDNLKARQNVIYTVAGVVAAIVTTLLGVLKSVGHYFLGSGGGTGS